MIETLKLSLWEIFAYFFTGLFTLVGSIILFLILIGQSSVDPSLGTSKKQSEAQTVSSCKSSYDVTVKSDDESKPPTIRISSCANGEKLKSKSKESQLIEGAFAIFEKLGAKEVLLLLPLILLLGILIEPIAALVYKPVLDHFNTLSAHSEIPIKAILTHHPEFSNYRKEKESERALYRIALHTVEKNGTPSIYDVYLSRFGFNRSASIICLIWGVLSLGFSSIGDFNGYLFTFISISFLLSVIYSMRSLDFYKLQGEVIYFSYANSLTPNNNNAKKFRLRALNK